MAPPADPHRPPTILGEYGEGYCRWCYFVVALNDRGRLRAHWRNTHAPGTSKKCDGSDTMPPRLTPYATRRAAFTSRAKRGTCPHCTRRVAMNRDGTMYVHRVDGTKGEYCQGGFSPPPMGRSYGRDRG